MATQTKTSYFPLGGGLDLTTPALSVAPGKALALTNYEPWFNGGYRRVDGFERYDGRPKPSEQSFYGFDVSDASSLSLGDTVTGDTSGATGIVIGIWIDDGTYGSDAIGLTKGSLFPEPPTTQFDLNEACNTAAFTVDRASTRQYAPSETLEDVWLLEAQDDYRDDILAVPGAGTVNGLWQRNANVYAVRNNVGETAGILHLSSAAGWVTTGITMTVWLWFDGGGGGTQQPLPLEGDTITGGTSLTSGDVHRIILHSGAVSGNDAAGYIVLTNITGGSGSFNDNEVLNESATKFADAASNSTVMSFPVDGHYRFHNHNFFAGSASYRTYGVNGVGPAFEIDESNVVSPILLPLTPLESQPENDLPFLIEEHRNYLFIAYPAGSLVHTVLGEPMVINGFLGAAEFGLGDEITGLNSVTGSVLAITTGRESRGLFGKTIDDWEMKLIGERTGGQLHTTQKLDTVYAFDDLGITSLARTDTFGDFIGSTVSQLIQPLVNNLKEHVTDSSLVRKSNQYRVYFDDDTALIMYVPNAGMTPDTRQTSRMLVQFGALSYPFPVRKIYNTEDENGTERTYFASDDGYAYEDQIGRNFDGVAVRSTVRVVYNQIKSPSIRKRFRRAVLELESQKPLALKVISDLTYGSEDTGSGNFDLDVESGGGLWDVDNWDEFYFDGQYVSTATVQLSGSGTNIGLIIFNESAVARPFIVQGITYHYDIRRLQR